MVTQGEQLWNLCSRGRLKTRKKESAYPRARVPVGLAGCSSPGRLLNGRAFASSLARRGLRCAAT